LIKRTAIVFDMDGLMVDTEPLSRQAWDEFLRPYGHSLDDKIISRMVGFRADESTRILLEAFDVPLSVEEIMRRKAAIYDEIRTRGVPVMPGFPELQAAIAERRLPWAVATSSPRRHAEEILGQLGLVGACHAIAGGDEVEDSGPGSQAAAAAGMLTVVIPGADMSAVNFSHADYVFSSLHEVAANLDELLAH
jgi:beta-phosphoglucomutase-like phosphatase (HAD superfamily)